MPNKLKFEAEINTKATCGTPVRQDAEAIDHQLLRRNKSVDEVKRQYVERLFQKHRYALLRYLIKLSLNEQDAAEILQETYLRLMGQQQLDRIEANARAYIFIIATNLVRDRYRRRTARHVEQHLPVEDCGLISDTPSPEAAAEWQEAVTLLKRGLFELSSLDRQIFLMYRFRYMPYDEIALALGISTRTVERHISVTMKYLRKKLQPYL